MMLRECIRHEALAKIILLDPVFYEFFKYVEVSTFDIASDAFSTFKVSLKIGPNIFTVAEYKERDIKKFK